MSDMKCPVCNVGYVHESVNHWCCDYEFCPSYNETDTETYDILIRTRKALDVAVNALNKIANTDIKVIEKEPLYYARAMFSVTNNALGRIQDIKQKDVK